MNFVFNLFYLLPFVLIPSVFALIILFSLSGTNKKFEKIIVIIYILLGVFVSSIFILVPIGMMWGIFDNVRPILVVMGILMIGQIIVKLQKIITNKMLELKVSDEQIYIRDIPSSYSPSVLSYLVNQKIERRKDFIATVVNLISKKVIKLEKTNDGKLSIKACNNKNEYLSKDEYYIYDWLIDNKSKKSMAEWEHIVIKEYKKLNFSKANKKEFSLVRVLSIAYLIFFAVIWILGITGLVDINANKEISKLITSTLVILFFSLFEGAAFSQLTAWIEGSMNKNSIYTKIGAIEMSRWNKFKKFIKDYTMIEAAPIESVIILERYLAYAIALDINKEYNKNIFNDLEGLLEFNLIKELDEYLKIDVYTTNNLERSELSSEM